MGDRLIKYFICLILLILVYLLIRPTLIDQRNLKKIVEALNTQRGDISLLKQDIALLKQKEVKSGGQ